MYESSYITAEKFLDISLHHCCGKLLLQVIRPYFSLLNGRRNKLKYSSNRAIANFATRLVTCLFLAQHQHKHYSNLKSKKVGLIKKRQGLYLKLFKHDFFFQQTVKNNLILIFMHNCIIVFINISKKMT